MKTFLISLSFLISTICIASPTDEAKAFFNLASHKLIAENGVQKTNTISSPASYSMNIERDTQSIFQKVYASIISALSILWGFVNIPFWIFLMISSAALNEGIEAENKMRFLTALREWPRGFRTMILGFLLAVIFIFFFTVVDKFGIFQYLFTIAWTMICLSALGNKIARWASEKYLHFDFGKKEEIKKEQ